MQAADKSDVASRLGPGGYRAYTPVQAFLLARLHDLVIRRQDPGLGNLDDAQARLLDKAVYATYCDCVDLGLAEEAREQLRITRKTTSSR